MVVLVALAAATSLAWTGRLTPPGAFDAIPQYWHDAADWLDEHNAGTPAGRVLVVPGAPFATQVWGTSHDEPLQVLGNSPWGVRDSIPLTPPQTIRALDSVQRLFAAGRPSAGLADTLARQGISYVVVRNDLDPETSRSARPMLVHRAIEGSAGLTKVAQFGEPVGPGTLAGFITDSGLRPRYPAVEIYRVDRRDRCSAGRAVPGRHRRDGPRRRRARGAAAARRAAQAAGPAAARADAADRRCQAGRVCRRRSSPSPTPRWHARPTTAASTTIRRRSARRTISGTPSTGCPTIPRAIPPWCYGEWTGGRITVSSSASDSTALPNVAPATASTAAVDGDSSTSWVSNALQSAVGQWLQVDFDHPVTNATITVTPSATAVGAQVRRIEISTANGTSTLRFDEAGKPITAALPYGETPWVRITAVGTDDGSAGVQFGITDFTVTQYDASGFAHPVELRHTVVVPGPPPNSAVAQWDLGSELLGRPGCAEGPDGVHCAPSMAPSPEEPVNLSRTLTVPEPMSVTPTVWVRAAAGPQPRRPDQPARDHPRLGRRRPDRRARLGVRGHRRRPPHRVDRAAARGAAPHAAQPDPQTARRPPRSPALRVTPSSSALPAHPKMVAIDLGRRPAGASAWPATPAPRRWPCGRGSPTPSKCRLLDWDDVIDRTALGFDQLKPPGLAEVTALDAAGQPIAAADAARNRARPIALPCGRGPIIAVAGQFVQTSIDTTVGALLDGDPIPARPCQPAADRAARGPAGAADQPRRRVRRRRRAAGRTVGP